MEQITILLIGGLIGGFIKYIFDVSKDKPDFQNQTYTTLMKDRWEQYQRLWTISGELPKWPRREGLTLEHIDDISSRLRQWYFGKGGMMLSKSARERYEPVQEALMAVYEKVENKEIPLEEADYENIRKKFSDLRSELTNDLMSRKRQVLS